jgi:hypothetical protein
LLNPNDLCLIALRLKEWRLYLQIIKINELLCYQAADGKRSLRLPQEARGTQDRVDFMLSALISGSQLFKNEKKATKLKKALGDLASLGEEFERTEI